MRLNDTIAAISSAVGPAARMIVRASGADCSQILLNLCPDCLPSPMAARLSLHLDRLRVPAWVYRFGSPRSYTGDDLFELHLPGNPVLARMVLERIIALGARAAEPGEFTARAYFNGRLDLAQAEGVAAIVSAANQAELDAGRRLMAGELSRRLRPTLETVAQTLALVEAEIDFSDQDVRFLSAEQVAARLIAVDSALGELLQQSSRLSRLSHEPRIVLAGRPNAGKSTLLNALSQSARAIVSPVAGTTRDALSAHVVLDRGIIQLVDVAGLDQLPAATEVETQMQARASRELETADAVILVREANDPRPLLQLTRPPDLLVITKIDLGDAACATSQPVGAGATRSLAISAIADIGMDRLRTDLDTLAFGANNHSAAELALTSRHVQAIESARQSIARAMNLHAAELMAAELRAALDALGQVLGDVSPDDILGRIFSTFCIGK